MDITKMKVNELINYLFEVEEKDLIQIIKSKQLNSLNDELFRSFFLKNNRTIKELILANEELFDRLINLKPNIHKRTILDIIDDETFELIVNNTYCLKYSNKIIDYLTHIKLHRFDELTKKIDFMKIVDNKSYLKDEKKMVEHLVNQGFDSNLVINLMVKIRTGLISPICVLKLENNYQLLILTKFNTLINVKENKNNVVFDNGEEIPVSLINSLNNKHLLGLFKLFNNKNSDNNTNNILATIKLYCVLAMITQLKLLTIILLV